MPIKLFVGVISDHHSRESIQYILQHDNRRGIGRISSARPKVRFPTLVCVTRTKLREPGQVSYACARQNRLNNIAKRFCTLMHYLKLTSKNRKIMASTACLDLRSSFKGPSRKGSGCDGAWAGRTGRRETCNLRPA